MTTFDFCDTTLPCGQRDVTIVPTQALALLNNQFVHARSQNLADRAIRLATNDDEQVEQVWRLALARSPTERERQQALEHLAQQRSHFAQQSNKSRSDADPTRLALESLSHVILNTNEFIFVD
jgi:hypothetical protein